MIRYHASWVLPISSRPIRDGWVAVEDDRIVGCGNGPAGGVGGPSRSGGERGERSSDLREVDLGSVAILPGLVNAHTHLELSYLRNQVPRCQAFVTWIRAVMAARRGRPDINAPDMLEPVDRAIREAVACGTAVVGDVTNTFVTMSPLVNSPLAAVVFYELIGFNVSDPDVLVDGAQRRMGACPYGDRVRAQLAAHAPYSVGPGLFRAIHDAVARDTATPSSLHLAESAEELEFIRAGTGPWRELLEEVGAWDEAWVASGVSPLQYIDAMGVLDSRLIVVHGVHLSASDLRTLARRGATLVTCPRSNGHTGAGVPPVRAFYEAGVPVALGTDSLASAPDLNLMAEIAAVRALAPEIPARALLRSATCVGARALGFSGEYGTIERGKRARLLAVSVPSVADVEEYLVGGIPPDQMFWLDSPGSASGA